MNNKANNGTVRTEQTKTEHTKHKVEFTHNEKFCMVSQEVVKAILNL